VLIVVVLAVPPDETVCAPARSIVAPTSVPPTVSVPPLDTTVPLAVPPDNTISLPPRIVVPLSRPPDAT
jgi:hypothetical protein